MAPDSSPAGDGSVVVIGHIVEVGGVDPGELPGHDFDHVAATHALGLQFAKRFHDGGHGFLAVADHDEIEEVGHRFGVVGLGAPGDHEGMGVVALGGAKRYASEIQERQDVGEAHLVLE